MKCPKTDSLSICNNGDCFVFFWRNSSRTVVGHWLFFMSAKICSFMNSSMHCKPVPTQHYTWGEICNSESEYLICKDVSNLLYQQVKDYIIKQIKRAKYFSVILDCAPDNSIYVFGLSMTVQIVCLLQKRIYSLYWSRGIYWCSSFWIIVWRNWALSFGNEQLQRSRLWN